MTRVLRTDDTCPRPTTAHRGFGVQGPLGRVNPRRRPVPSRIRILPRHHPHRDSGGRHGRRRPVSLPSVVLSGMSEVHGGSCLVYPVTGPRSGGRRVDYSTTATAGSRTVEEDLFGTRPGRARHGKRPRPHTPHGPRESPWVRVTEVEVTPTRPPPQPLPLLIRLHGQRRALKRGS